MQQDKKYYNNFYKKHGAGVHYDPARFSEIAKLCRGKVLDVACGTGTLADFYAGDYVGVDISDRAIEFARAVRRKDAVFLVSDIFQWKNLTGEKFDTIVLAEFLEHIKDDAELFDMLKNWAVSGCRLIVSVPNADRVPDESHARTFTVPELRKKFAQFGAVKFYNWSGVGKRIIVSCDFGAKTQDDVSLVMIVKDEQKGIERAILSALPLVDRVVVSVDTNTTDQTADIARLYADELRFHEWQGDFSAARNSAQENVKTKWILFLDGHEYIESLGDIRLKLKADVEGVFVTIRMESGMTFLFPRFYRSYIKFKNKVHNLNECKTRRCAPECVIVHDRLGGQDEDSATRRGAQREAMLPAEMKEQIKSNPKNARAHFHLANFYMMRHERKLAMKHYKKVIKYGHSPDEKYMAFLHFGALHASFNHPFRALLAFSKADKLLPGRWESARTIGGLYLMTSRHKKALPWLVQALTPNSRRYAYQPMQQNLVEIWDLIGHCFAKLDQNPQAITAWERAVELASSDTQKKFFQEKIKLVKMLL